ncbi:14.7 kDa heat shock protein-like [Silene latifolia]|uniref:14.7 kDa heat shock protein-like n=1 Tax=Silene latifolia TaxID=37657 RepID=UPI003D77C324
MSHLTRFRPFLRHATRKYCTSLPPWAPPSMKPAPDKPWMPNGAMKRGPKSFMDYWESETGVNLWVLMPGVPKGNVTVNVTANKISFHGIELLNLPGFPVSKDEEFKREYDGFFFANPTRFDAAKIKAEIVDGIFWLHVPKLSH